VTKPLKNSIGLIYGMYALAFWQSQLCPRWLSKFVVNQSSRFTVAFSNVPGPIKPVFWEAKEPGKPKLKIVNKTMKTYVIVAGKLGLNIAC